MESTSRATPEQLSVLIDFIERHRDLLKVEPDIWKVEPAAPGRLKRERLWQKLASLLNSIGGGVKNSSDDWKKVWTDWNTATKEKCLMVMRHGSGTGGGSPSSRHTLTDLEDRLIKVIGVAAVVGLPGIREAGFGLQGDSSLVQTRGSSNDTPSAQEEESGLERFFLEADYSQNTEPVQNPPPSDVSPARHIRTPPFQLASSAPPPLMNPPAPGSRRQALVPPRLAAPTPNRRLLLRARKNRGLTPFDRATSEFIAVERRRLEFEERRDRRLYQLALRRIEVDRQHNQLLNQIAVLGENLIDVLTQQRSASLPSINTLVEVFKYQEE